MLYWISHCGANTAVMSFIEVPRFNPCCIGLAIAGTSPSRVATDDESFNPCCIGLAIAGYWLPETSGTLRRFQSLLYWISHCGLAKAAAQAGRWQCFNPCCIGLAIAGRKNASGARSCVRFQSLLYWISHCGQPPLRPLPRIH